MTARLPFAPLLAAAVLLPSAAAPAYPPITCGRISHAGKPYVVRTHGPNCSFAMKWSRSFASRHRAPSGFRCKAYGTSVPVQCINRKHRKSYFMATQAS